MLKNQSLKTIAYIELDTHAEIAYNFMALMAESRLFYVEYYFSEKIMERIPNRSGNITVLEADKLLNALRGKHYDFVILGTAHRNFNIYEKLVKEFPTYIISHNLNFVEASPSVLFRNILKKDKRYRLKLLLKEGLLHKDKVYKKAKGLLVLEESLVRRHIHMGFHWLPVFYTQFPNHSPRENVVAIPGTVDQKRRNYKRILRKIKYFKSEFSFIFLGKVEHSTYKMLQNTEKDIPKNIEINYFKERVPAEVFNQKIMESSVLWCPIQEETEFMSVTEIYGKTKVSGNIADAIRYGKPAIFPKSYFTHYSFIFKEEKDIENQILHINEKNFDFANFQKDIVLKELENVLSIL